jgi:virginiamycin B lyase
MQSRWQLLLLVVLVLVGAAVGIAQQALAQIITEFPLSTGPRGIVTGPDGVLWFTEPGANKIGRITTSGVITEFPVGSIGLYYGWITAGPDGALWFTESAANKIGRITTAGVLSEFPVPTANSAPTGIALGPDGNLWFSEVSANNIGRVTTAGVFAEFPIPTGGSGAWWITPGPDGALWFDEFYTNKIGRITTAGVITEFPVPTSNSGPSGITTGPDGALWFCEQYGDKIGRITTGGVFSEFPIPTAGSNSQGIAVGPDGALWFAENVSSGKVGRITTAGMVTEFGLPAAGANPFGVTSGPDGALWFTDYANNIGRVVPTTPQELLVVPGSGIVALGPQGGTFSPSSFSYTLSATTGSLGYSITTPNWLTATPKSGTLTTAAKNITIRINANADKLAPNNYFSSINFDNTTNSQGNTTRVATLIVDPKKYKVIVRASPSADGTVTGGGTFIAGNSTTVTAIANSGHSFVHWTENGRVVSTSPNYTFTMPSANITLAADFH